MEHLTALLIADNPTDAYLLGEMLTQASAEHDASDVTVDVVYADRLAAGLDCLHDGTIDVVLLGLSLPDRQGLETLESLEHAGCAVPVVVMTGVGDMAFGVKVMQHGAQDYLIKGQIQPGTLVQSLRYAMERQQLRRDLQTSEARFRQLIVGSADGTIVLDDDGVIRFANPAAVALLGREHRELLGLSFGLPVCLGRPMELDVVYTGGPETIVEMQVVPIAWEGDRAFLASLHDITRRKRVEAQLHKREAQLRQVHNIEAVGRLAGGMAHEFNNLLTAIIGYSNILVMRLEKENALHRHASQISLVASRAALLTRQLLAFSRQETPQPEVLDCNGMVRDTETTLRSLIGIQVALVYQLGTSLWRIRCDPVQLQQVLINLVENARDAISQERGTIEIRTANVVLDDGDRDRYLNAPPGNYVRLEVSDTGRGMGSEVKTHLFEPFFTTKAVAQGGGLGLSVVYGIVQQNAGDLAVDSEPGEGTRFQVYFPQIASPLASASSRGGPGSSEVWETVLLVEDEEHVREPIREMLELQGYRVVEAVNADEALQCMKTCEPPIHLLLTDVIMPGKNGYELAMELSAHNPDMRILMMSGHTDDILRRHPEPPAGLKFLQKPFTPDVLASKVREVLNQLPSRSLD
jgi:signal transduction histidine kinase